MNVLNFKEKPLILAMPTNKPKVTVIFDEPTMDDIRHLAENEYRSLSQMVAVLVREALEGRRDRQSNQGGKRDD